MGKQKDCLNMPSI